MLMLLGKKLSKVEMKIASKVGSGNKLFGSVTALDVASLPSKQKAMK